MFLRRSDVDRAGLAGELLDSRSPLGGAFSALLERARCSHPCIDIAAASFAAHVASILDLSASDLCRALAELRAGDLYLACGCVSGNAAALTTFDRQCLRAMKTRIRAIDTAPAELDEVRQMLRERLLVARRGELSRLARYSGKGSLAGWVAAAARRVALSRLSRLARERARADATLAGPVASVSESHLDWARLQHVGHLQSALRSALERLEPRHQRLLRLHVVQGLSLSRIAASYGVSQSTVSRWFDQARRRVRREARAWLSRVAGLDSIDLPSLARDLEGHLALDLSSALGPLLEV